MISLMSSLNYFSWKQEKPQLVRKCMKGCQQLLDDKLLWNKLISMTTDGLPHLTGKGQGLF